MAISLGTGLEITSKDEADNRYRYPTVEAALTTGGEVDGQMRLRLSNARRYEGLQVYILDEQKYYHFKGGIANENFVPLVDAQGMSAADSTNLQTLAAKLTAEGYLAV